MLAQCIKQNQRLNLKLLRVSLSLLKEKGLMRKGRELQRSLKMKNIAKDFREKNGNKQVPQGKYFTLILISLIFCQLVLAGCSSMYGSGIPSAEDLAAVYYTPIEKDDWQVSTPEAQGIDPLKVSELYYNARKLDTIYSVLVVKDDLLIAEGYFNGGFPNQKALIQSVTKSFTSASVGLAIQEGFVESVDQKMMDFFPELQDQITDPRKNQITIKQMLQMRAGYPWEESSTELFNLLYYGFRPSTLVDVPLNKNPDAKQEYSNLTSHLLALIVARASGMDLRAFDEKYLFSKLGISAAGSWYKDWEGNYIGHGGMRFTAREMAKFGLLYLNDGVYEGEQVIPEDWVEDSLTTYSHNAWKYRVGRNFKDIGYGYQWWTVRAGDHNYSLAWGHGGQQIALVHDLNMVIVVTADPQEANHGDSPWKYEKENLNLIADFIASLPGR